jgi:hypothetical protein
MTRRGDGPRAGLIQHALARLRDQPPARPLVILTGHTHSAWIERFRA